MQIFVQVCRTKD